MKKNLSIILNLLVIVLEIIALNITIYYNHRFPIEYYTDDSNILALISTSIFLLYFIIKKETPKWVQQFKYMTTICLTVTFLVVIFILAPMYNFNYKFMLFYRTMPYTHLLCPVLSIITFVFFDDTSKIEKKDIISGTLLTIIYGTILLVCNILKLIEGPYPFLMVYKQPVIMSIIWFIIIIGFSYVIGLSLRKLNIKYNLK